MTPYRTLLAAALAAVLSCGARAGVVAPELETELAARAPHEELSVIVSLSDKVDHGLFRARDRKSRDPRHVRALREKAARTQGVHKAFLRERGARRLRELWAINGIAVTVRADAIRELAQRPGIESIRLDGTLQGPVVTYAAGAPPEWNLASVHAPDLWNLGHAGAGIVVASMDTGVDAQHPDLAGRWRGGANSWFDVHGQHAAPHDGEGHGTMVMGVMVGGGAGGTAIGVAPEARWITVRVFNDAGLASFSDIHLGFQWLLDPDGDPQTTDMPDVVNASWGLVDGSGRCVNEFAADIEALRAAGIAIVFAAGNSGPDPMSSVSPANNGGTFATGAVDDTMTVASFSSRGPSACGGGIYPQLVAPGVNIHTADLSFGGMPLYAVVTGTSFAAPHTAGVLALLAGAFPEASLGDFEAALTQSAPDRGVAGADNAYGYGLVDALAAFNYLNGPINHPPSAAADAYTLIKGGTLTVPAPGILANDTDPDEGDTLAAAKIGPLLVADAAASLVVNADGGFSFTPGAGFRGTNSFRYKAQDGSGVLSAPPKATVTLDVIVNRAPVAVADAASAPVRTVVRAEYPPVVIDVLANDYDPDTEIDPGNRIDPATLRITQAPSMGGLATVNEEGTISYWPKRNFAGTETFRYRVNDNYHNPGAAFPDGPNNSPKSSLGATVSVTVQ